MKDPEERISYSDARRAEIRALLARMVGPRTPQDSIALQFDVLRYLDLRIAHEIESGRPKVADVLRGFRNDVESDMDEMMHACGWDAKQ